MSQVFAVDWSKDASAGVQAEPLAPSRWDWHKIERVLIVRLRSIGDTVLATPALIALRRFLPAARLDILLEDWVAPLLDQHAAVDNVISAPRDGTVARTVLAARLRATAYDVVYNLHGGSTASLLTRATGARFRVGYAAYRQAKLHNQHAPPASTLWQRAQTHSAEQQLALLGWTGVPVSDRPRSNLTPQPAALASVYARLAAAGVAAQAFALIHPASLFATKMWASEKFALVAAELAQRGLAVVAVASQAEVAVLEALKLASRVPIVTFTDLSLPELTALASCAQLFVGNDSGVAHIAAATGTRCVVIFGSSNVAHWRPWSSAPALVVREPMPCAPCPGYECAEFAQPECIGRVRVASVIDAVDQLLKA